MILPPCDARGPQYSAASNPWRSGGRVYSGRYLRGRLTLHSFSGSPAIFALLAVIVILVPSTASSYSAETTFHFGNRYVERVFVVRDGVFRTSELRDKFPREPKPFLAVDWPYSSMRVSSTEFAIYPQSRLPLTSYDFFYRTRRLNQLPDGGRELKVRLEGKTVPIDVVVCFRVVGDEPWMRKQIIIKPKTPVGSEISIERIDVERLGYAQGGGSGGGLGQPIFFATRNQFFGLEYPAAHDDYQGGVITLTQYPARQLGKGLLSKSAVWGVAPAGDVRKEFLQNYIPSWAVHYPPRPFVNFDESWNGGVSTTEAIAEQTISILNKHLVEQGIPVESYSFPQWQDYDSIWLPSRELFPHGFAPVQRMAEAAGMRLGLWLSLTGGTLNTYWGVAHGMKAARDSEVNGPYCIADPAYQNALETALQGYIQRNRVNFFWCDYNDFSCAAPGYPAGSPEALEASVDAYIHVLNFIHKLNPSVKIELTTGMWLSPWWLKYADWVWLGGSDIDFITPQGRPSLETAPRWEPPRALKRYAEITYRDSVMWSDLRRDRDAFPTWGLKTHGFYNWVMIGGAPDPEAGFEDDPSCCDEPLNQWQDHVVSSLLRGISDWNLLLNLHWMSRQKWDYLVAALKWGRDNWILLSTTDMIGGNPARFQVYGYTHFRNGHALIMVRNPAGTSQEYDLPLASSVHTGVTANRVAVNEIYPCERPVSMNRMSGDRLRLSLKPYETEVIELGKLAPALDSLAAKSCAKQTLPLDRRNGRN